MSLRCIRIDAVGDEVSNMIVFFLPFSSIRLLCMYLVIPSHSIVPQLHETASSFVFNGVFEMLHTNKYSNRVVSGRKTLVSYGFYSIHQHSVQYLVDILNMVNAPLPYGVSSHK